MQRQTELWTESEPLRPNEILGEMIRGHLERETVLRLDLSYVGRKVNAWWGERHGKVDEETIGADLRSRILIWLSREDLAKIASVGRADAAVSAVFLENVFSRANRDLARLVHEAMSEIAGIVDVKYPYEEHKELFPAESDRLASDWGKGLGIIRPHSDDLYEDRSVNMMCLTVCNDTSSTPTWFWMLKDLVSAITDEELGTLCLAEATYLSGTNVKGTVIESCRQVLRRDPDEGIGMRLDFRIDDAVGPRMRFADPVVQSIFEKLRAGLRTRKPISSNPSTGSVSILANYKILHGRAALKPLMLYAGGKSRILFRSKGMK